MPVQPSIEAINAGGPAVRLIVPGFQGVPGFSILSGPTDPDPALGNDNDFYINYTDWTIFGPKAGGAWGSGTSLGGGGGGDDGLSVLSGTAVPDPALGRNGEFYIRTGVWTIYGPKAAGVWGSPTSLIGAPGDDGTNGLSVLSGAAVPAPGLGRDGEFYIRTGVWTIYGPKTAGSWGSPTPLAGPPGPAGPFNFLAAGLAIALG